MDYEAFLRTKTPHTEPQGLQVRTLPSRLFPFQRQIASWAIAQGRAALFLDTGLGKTSLQLAWAQHVAEQAGDVLILCPLAVAAQTAREAAMLDIGVTVCRTGADVRPGVNLLNYERLHLVDAARFAGIVLDESSILKHFEGATRTQLIDTFSTTPYRLCCTATPAPNDHMELGNHAEFLGVCTRAEMLSTYFVHDGGATSQWRLKGHAVEPFWRWVASWAVALTDPAALGDRTPGYALPPLAVHTHTLSTAGMAAQETLFLMEATALAAQRHLRRAGMARRVEALVAMVNASQDSWILWGDLNDECDALEARIPGAIQVAGKDSLEVKEARLHAFQAGDARVLISKSSICGYGLNWQHCAHIGFAGLTHSFESWYQAVKRCHRYGQTRPVEVHMMALDAEAPILRNLQRKQRDNDAMRAVMQHHLLRFFVHATTTPYGATQPLSIPAWLTSEEFTYA